MLFGDLVGHKVDCCVNQAHFSYLLFIEFIFWKIKEDMRLNVPHILCSFYLRVSAVSCLAPSVPHPCGIFRVLSGTVISPDSFSCNWGIAWLPLRSTIISSVLIVVSRYFHPLPIHFSYLTVIITCCTIFFNCLYCYIFVKFLWHYP